MSLPFPLKIATATFSIDIFVVVVCIYERKKYGHRWTIFKYQFYMFKSKQCHSLDVYLFLTYQVIYSSVTLTKYVIYVRFSKMVVSTLTLRNSN